MDGDENGGDGSFELSPALRGRAKGGEIINGVRFFKPPEDTRGKAARRRAIVIDSSVGGSVIDGEIWII